MGYTGRTLDVAVRFGAAAGTYAGSARHLAAIRLDQRPGFEQIGIRRGYHLAPDGREDAIVLKLDLRQA